MEPQSSADRLINVLSTHVPVKPAIIGTPTKKSSSIKSEPPLDFPDVHLQSDPGIPTILFDGLRLAAASRNLAPEAVSKLEDQFRDQLSRATVQSPESDTTEETVKLQFSHISSYIDSVTNLFGFDATLAPCPKDFVIPDFVYTVLNPTKKGLIVELKNPLCGAERFGEIVSAAARGEQITVAQGRTGYRSIVLKLAYYLRHHVHGVSYALLLDMQNFVILQAEHSEASDICTFRVSNCVSIDSKETPFIAIVAQILRSAHEIGAAQDAAQDDDSEFGHSESGGSAPQARPSSPASSPAPETYGTSLNTVNYASLAAILQETERLAIRWSIPRYKKIVWSTNRCPNSTVWHTALPRTKSAATIRSPDPCTPPPSPPSLPSVPFEICLDRQIAYHVLGGHIPGVSTPLVLKLLRTNRAEQELAIFRKLQHLAGTRIPGVLGVYLFDGIGYGPQAFIVQQDVGTTLDDFSTLNLDQRTELYDTVLQIHRAGVNHGDIAPRNVAIDDNGKVAVFDFDLSEFHDCPGEASCRELKELRLDLDLKRKTHY